MNTLKQIREKLGHCPMQWKPTMWLKTPIPDLNRVLGDEDQGIPYGTITEVSGWECLAGETLIDCPRDMEVYPQGIPIKDLVGKQPWVYGFDVSEGRIVLRRATRVWRVGRRPVYKVTFRVSKNSVRIFGKQPEYIIATANHPFMLRRRSDARSKFSPAYDWEAEGYRILADLKPGDRIMPFFRGRSNDTFVVNLNNGKTETEHRFILSEIYGARPGNVWDGHHKDENRMNNAVDNLEWLTASEHMSHHLRKRNLEKRTGWQKHGVHPRGMLGKSQTAEMREMASQINTDLKAEEFGKWAATAGVTREMLEDLYHHKKMTLVEVGKAIGRSLPGVRTALRRFGIPRRDPYWFQKNAKRNHIVEKVEFHGYEDVYDMTVPGTNNFVANGVVVHNSQGKTSIMLALEAMGQMDGAHVVHGDIENSFTAKWARQRGFALCPKCEGTGLLKRKEKTVDCDACGGAQSKTCGLDTDKLSLIYPYVGNFTYKDKKTGKLHREKEPRLANAEELCSEIDLSMGAGHEKSIVILDSIAALLTEGESAAGIENSNMRTKLDLPMFMSSLLRRWVGTAQVHNAWIVLINQLREGPGGFGDSTKTVGGNAARFYSHTRVRVRRTKGGRIMDKGKLVGITGVMKSLKNKSGGEEGAEVGYRLIFNGSLEFIPAKDAKKNED